MYAANLNRRSNLNRHLGDDLIRRRIAVQRLLGLRQRQLRQPAVIFAQPLRGDGKFILAA